MITKIFNAKNYYDNMLFKLSQKINYINFNYNKNLYLSILVVGNDFSKHIYVKNKISSCKKVNIKILLFKFSTNISNKTFIIIIKLLNLNNKINAILIQMPIITRLNNNNIFSIINLNKDVDMLNPLNFGKYIMNYEKQISSCTSQSVINFFKLININLNGLKITLFGFSNIVGKPLLFDLNYNGATITLINKTDTCFKYILLKSDIIISAIGVIDFLFLNNISYGTILIDIGINTINNNYIVGDFFFYKFLKKTKYITPVPGGIGLLTIINLICNIINLFLIQNNLKKGILLWQDTVNGQILNIKKK